MAAKYQARIWEVGEGEGGHFHTKRDTGDKMETTETNPFWNHFIYSLKYIPFIGLFVQENIPFE